MSCFLHMVQGELRISVLPTHLSYDAPWPVRKVPLRCTPHFVAYNRESKVQPVIYYPKIVSTSTIGWVFLINFVQK